MTAAARPVDALPALSKPGRRVTAKFAADVAGRGLILVVFVLAARTLSIEGFGAYAFAVAVGITLAQIADSGLQVTLLRRLAAEPVEAARGLAVAGAVRARTTAGLVLGVAAAVAAAAAGADPTAAISLAVIATSQIVAAQSDLWLQVPRAHGRLDIEAVVALTWRATFAVIAGAALLAGSGLAGLAAAYAVSALVGVGAARRMARRFVPAAAAGAWRGIGRLYVEALPIGIAGVTSMLMTRLGVLLIEILRGPAEVAAYSAAARPFEASFLLPAAIMAALFPRLVRAREDPVRLRGLIGRGGGLLLGCAVAAAVAGGTLGPMVLHLAFGPAYADSGDVLRVLVLALPPIFLNAMLTQALVALGRPWALVGSMVVGLLVNLGAGLLWIPSLGALGGAMATVAAEVGLMGSAVFAVWLGRRFRART